jgi:CRP/FNR family cyclic AMP-dependent transcriptional regulator
MEKQKELIDALQCIPWFQELTPAHFDKIREISHIVEIKRDTPLFSEGDQQDYMYIVLEGRIALEIIRPVRGRMRIYTAEPMDVVGWSSVTPVVRQRTASATAVLDSRLIAIDAKALRKISDEDHELGYIIMRRTANVIAARLLVTRLQLSDIHGHAEGEDYYD